MQGIPERNMERISELHDINVASWNLCGFSDIKRCFIINLINTYNLDIIWLIDCRRKISNIKGFSAIYSDDPLINVLLIRNSLVSADTVKEIEYGLSFAGISFRYIRPNENVSYINWTSKEIGDFNWLSHKWIKLNFNLEERNGKPGGMGTNIENPIFINSFKSDHDVVIVRTKFEWTPKVNVGYYQLENAMNYAAQTKFWRPIFGRSNLNFIEKDERYKDNSRQSKIINLKDYNLNLDVWYNLYNHDNNKYIKWKENINTLSKLEIINSKALDVNKICARLAIQIFNKFNSKQKENLLYAWNVLKRQTRAIALRKKDREIHSVGDTRLIQIYPVQLKIQENARIQLRKWLEKQHLPVQYGFVKDRSTIQLLHDWFKQIRQNENG
jgi:hypothetical protein